MSAWSKRTDSTSSSARVPFPALHAEKLLQRTADDAAHGVAAVERSVRVLEDDLERAHLLGAPLSTLPASRSPSISTIEPSSGAVRPRRTRARVVLPLPDSPTSPSISPGPTTTETSDERLHVLAVLVEGLAELVDAQERRAVAVDARPGAARASRAAAPARLSWKWQRLACPSPSWMSAGSCSRQISSASAQRSAKTQPGRSRAEAAAGSRGSCRAGRGPCARRRAGCSGGGRRCRGGAGRGRPPPPAPPRRAGPRRARRRARTSCATTRGCG